MSKRYNQYPIIGMADNPNPIQIVSLIMILSVLNSIPKITDKQKPKSAENKKAMRFNNAKSKKCISDTWAKNLYVYRV